MHYLPNLHPILECASRVISAEGAETEWPELLDNVNLFVQGLFIIFRLELPKKGLSNSRHIQAHCICSVSDSVHCHFLPHSIYINTEGKNLLREKEVYNFAFPV